MKEKTGILFICPRRITSMPIVENRQHFPYFFVDTKTKSHLYCELSLREMCQLLLLLLSLAA